jgi:hypothetical protein
MRLSRNAKRRKELSGAVKTLRDQCIQVTGPYRRPNGMLVSSVGNRCTLIWLHQLCRPSAVRGADKSSVLGTFSRGELLEAMTLNPFDEENNS